ncbi:MAG: hypothetical protein AAFP04_00860 [Myxococcota bacterium]
MRRSEQIGRAARRLLDALDVLELDGFHDGERAVHRAIRKAAEPDALAPLEVWSAACEIEVDPLRRQRAVLGDGWRPRLT